jgi:hypothetical protein
MIDALRVRGFLHQLGFHRVSEFRRATPATARGVHHLAPRDLPRRRRL